MKLITFLISLFCISLQVQSQVYSIEGSVKNGDDDSAFPGVTITLQTPEDSVMLQGTVTELDGSFILKDIEPGRYRLKIKFIG